MNKEVQIPNPDLQGHLKVSGVFKAMISMNHKGLQLSLYMSAAIRQLLPLLNNQEIIRVMI